MIHTRAMLLALAVGLVAATACAADKAYRAPRTVFGAPQLEGVWTNSTYTQLERPKEFKALAATPAEAKAFEARLKTTGGVNIPKEADTLGQADSEFPETGGGMSRIRGEIRTSHIVEPADGKIPWTEAARKRLHIDEHGWQGYDNPEQRSENERCLAAASTGAPILSSEDANVLQILQTRDHVVVLTEKYHDARIIRLPGAPAPHGPSSWLGDSVGHWEGDTLVATTTNLRAGVTGHGDDLSLTDATRVDERFTRIAPGEVLYEFTVTDPSLFSRPWRGEMLFTTSPGRWFEYACHEGNYSIVTILQAARLGRQPEPKADAPSKAAAP
jgi:hypothetical protein